MLVLSRKVDERVVIETPSGERIDLVVIGVDGGRVKLGFDAAPEVDVDRLEVFRRRQAECERESVPFVRVVGPSMEPGGEPVLEPIGPPSRPAA